jgi:K+-sensing histidine kinase KdpD
MHDQRASRIRAVDGRSQLRSEHRCVVVDGGQPVFVVAGSGPGIAPSERGAVLRTFYRGRAFERSVPGDGLGLSLVAAIARVHDAAVEVLDNEPGCRM